MAGGSGAGMRKRGLRKPQHKHETVVKNSSTGIEYTSTGSDQPGVKKDKGKEERKKFTLKNYLIASVEQAGNAAAIGVVLLTVLYILWQGCRLPAVQDAFRTSRTLHGFVDVMKRHPSEKTGWCYTTVPVVYHLMLENPENQIVVQQEDGLMPLVKLVNEDANFVITRLALASIQAALGSEYVWTTSHGELMMEVLVNYMKKNSQHGLGKETAAAIVARMARWEQFHGAIQRTGAMPAVQKVAEQSGNPELTEAAKAALSAISTMRSPSPEHPASR